MQHNSSRIGTLFHVESESLSKEDENPNGATVSSIKREDEINHKQTRAMEKNEHIEKKVVKMQNGESSSKSKAKPKKERGTPAIPRPHPINENIIITFHKGDEASRKALMEKFGPLGFREEALMNDDKGKSPP